MKIELTKTGHLPSGLSTFYVVEDYTNNFTVYGRFTTLSEAAACQAANRRKFHPDPVIRQAQMIPRL